MVICERWINNWGNGRKVNRNSHLPTRRSSFPIQKSTPPPPPPPSIWLPRAKTAHHCDSKISHLHKRFVLYAGLEHRVLRESTIPLQASGHQTRPRQICSKVTSPKRTLVWYLSSALVLPARICRPLNCAGQQGLRLATRTSRSREP